MSIKRFCDICGAELTDKNTPNGGDSRNRLVYETKSRSGHRLTVEVITAIDGTWNSGDVCNHCIIDCVKAKDDRPQEEPESRVGRNKPPTYDKPDAPPGPPKN